MNPLHVSPLSLDLAWKDEDENLRRLQSALERLAEKSPKGAKVVVFPELTLSGFVTSEPNHLDDEQRMIVSIQELARKFETSIVAGFPSRSPNGGIQNILGFWTPDQGLIARYAKTHLFTLGAPSEAETYESGTGPLTLTHQGWKIGMSTCFDLRFSDLYDFYQRERCDLVINAACWVGGPFKALQYRTLSQARAILTQSYFLSVNRMGSDPHFQYEGGAYVFTPQGEPLLEKTGEWASLTPDRLELARKLKVV